MRRKIWTGTIERWDCDLGGVKSYVRFLGDLPGTKGVNPAMRCYLRKKYS